MNRITYNPQVESQRIEYIRAEVVHGGTVDDEDNGLMLIFALRLTDIDTTETFALTPEHAKALIEGLSADLRSNPEVN